MAHSLCSGRFGARTWAILLALAVLGDRPLGAQEAAPPLEASASKPEGTLVDGFETGRPVWRQEETDATFLLRDHDRTDRAAREGRYSERFRFQAGLGSALYYSYAVPRTPVVEDLKATLYVRANRPGVQLFGRVILPADTDPETGRPTSILVPGTSYDAANRWQRIELSDLPVAIERQARVLRLGTGRPISLEGAYLERLVVNLYGGPGESEVFLDELRLSPVVDATPARPAPEDSKPEPAASDANAPSTKARIQLGGNYLTKDGYDWFPQIVSAPGADLETLRRVGFDVLALEPGARQDVIGEAVRLGFLLMPALGTGHDVDVEATGARLANDPFRDAVAFWNLGSALGASADPRLRQEELERIRRLIRSVHEQPEGSPRIATATVAGWFEKYALFGQNLDLVGVEARGIGSAMEPIETYHYLANRRTLTATKNPNAPFWAWIDVTAPDVLRTSVWGFDAPPAWGWPRVQPEQLRIYAFAALSAGYRGLAFRADAELTRASGQARLYELTLLIAQIRLLEAILARSSDPIAQWPAFPPDPKPVLVYNSTGMAGGFSQMGRNGNQTKFDEVKAHPEIKVTSIDTADTRSKLLLVNAFAQGGQWQPGQMAVRDLNLLIPAPESAQAFEISLGGVDALTTRRDTGGRRITIPTFDTATMVLVTTDLAAVDQIRAAVESIRPRAVDILIKQAELQYQEVAEINAMLASEGYPIRNAEDLLMAASRSLQSAREARDRQDFSTAWSEARTVGQALRMVMRGHWNKALYEVRKAVLINAKTDGLPPVRSADGVANQPAPLVSPVACPPLLTFQTLPQLYKGDWLKAILGSQVPFGPNRLPSGSFEDTASAIREAGWVDESYAVEGVKASLSIKTGEGWGESRQAIRLEVVPAAQVDDEAFRKPDGTIDAKAKQKALLETMDALPPFLDHPAAAVRSPSVKVERAGALIRIRVLVKMLRQLPASSGGLIVRDSLGGELLQFRTTTPTFGWKEVVLYRRAPGPCEVSVLLGLSGFGEAFFDDLRIDVLGDVDSSLPPAPNPNPVARQPLRTPRSASAEPAIPSGRPRR